MNDEWMDYMLLLDEDEDDEPQPSEKVGCGCLPMLLIGAIVILALLWRIG